MWTYSKPLLHASVWWKEHWYGIIDDASLCMPHKYDCVHVDNSADPHSPRSSASTPGEFHNSWYQIWNSSPISPISPISHTFAYPLHLECHWQCWWVLSGLGAMVFIIWYVDWWSAWKEFSVLSSFNCATATFSICQLVFLHMPGLRQVYRFCTARYPVTGSLDVALILHISYLQENC